MNSTDSAVGMKEYSYFPPPAPYHRPSIFLCNYTPGLTTTSQLNFSSSYHGGRMIEHSEFLELEH